MTRPTIPISQVKVGTRMRQDLGDVQALANSIKELGLIQPIVLDEHFNLIDGGRRFHACTEILKLTEIAFTVKDCEDESQLRMMELEANIRAKPMDWKEKVQCVAEVHRLHKIKANAKGEKWTQQMTGELLNASVGDVNYSVKIAGLLKDPKHPVQKAESLMDAFRILCQLKEDEANKKSSTFAQELITSAQTTAADSSLIISADGVVCVQNTASSPSGPASTTLSIDANIKRDPAQIVAEKVIETPSRKTMTIELSKYFSKGSCLEHMAAMANESIDLIVTDPPFGIDMENLEDTERVEAEHQVDANIKLLQDWFPQAFRVLKDKSWCVVWYDFMYHGWIVDVAEDAGFSVCRWPLIWVKTHKNRNQAASYNFTKATEVALVCRKGNATLNSPQGTNYWIGSNDEDRAKYSHKFVKPDGLWRWIFQAVGHKGQVVYDPFMGRGSSIFAAVKMGYYPRGSEINELHYNGFIADFKTLMGQWYGQQFDLKFT